MATGSTQSYAYPQKNGPPGPTQPSGSVVQFADFAPSFPSDWTNHEPNFEHFEALVVKANDWLRQNPRVKVLTCESIELKGYDKREVDYTSSYFLDITWKEYYLRILRLWYTIFPEHVTPEPQFILFLNFVPQRRGPQDFEDFSAMLERANQYIEENSLPGPVITIETVAVKINEKQINDPIQPNITYWRDYERNKRYIYYLQCLRVFMLRGPSYRTRIGCADFSPTCIRPFKMGFIPKMAEYEPMGVVLKRASDWIISQPNINLINIQTVDCDVGIISMKFVPFDSRRSVFREYYFHSHLIHKIRFARVCFTHGAHGTNADEIPRTIRGPVSCCVFEPCVTSCSGMMEAGAIPLCAETIPLRLYTERYRFHPEQTYTYPLGSQDDTKYEHILFAIRLFIVGDYCEPSAALLPPVPVPQPSPPYDCCAIL